MRRLAEYFKSNLWLLPAALVFLAIIAAEMLLEFDRRVVDMKFIENWPWIFSVGAEGAREMLSTIAGSVITVAGVAFSITIVVLSMASNQYSPRVLRNFMGDWRSQAVLGGFLAIFSYCLIVLRTVRMIDGREFVPSFAMFGSVCLALVAISLVIYFIHHIANSIRATNIIRSVFDETFSSIAALEECPPNYGNVASEKGQRISEFTVASESSGYVQSIDTAKILQIAKACSTKFELEVAPGDFVVEKFALLSTTSSELSASIRQKLRGSVRIGRDRTMEQDLRFGFRQLVDIALKGLSPGINDTTTALIAIDYLGALLAKLSSKDPNTLIARRPNSGTEYGESQGGVLTLKHREFSEFLDLSFDQIRQNGANNPAVLASLLQSISNLLDVTNGTSRQLDAIKHLEKLVVTLTIATPRHEFVEVLSDATDLAYRWRSKRTRRTEKSDEFDI